MSFVCLYITFLIIVKLLSYQIYMSCVLFFLNIGTHISCSFMVFLQDYVATRWYRAPELCGSFFSKVWLPPLVSNEVLTAMVSYENKTIILA